MKFSGEEYIKIGEIAKPFWERGVSGKPPQFVFVMGGPGSGKTTSRRQDFATGYVNFDFGEIYLAIKKEFEENNPKLSSYATLAGDMILRESIAAKKNIVVEIIGDNIKLIDPLIDKMKELGYEISVRAIQCDIIEAYKRHLKAVEEDKSYFSAHISELPTLSFFYDQLGLGEMPVSEQNNMDSEVIEKP